MCSTEVLIYNYVLKCFNTFRDGDCCKGNYQFLFEIDERFYFDYYTLNIKRTIIKTSLANLSRVSRTKKKSLMENRYTFE